MGLSVNATNVGSRNVNIIYLGISVKDKSLSDGQNKMAKIHDEITGTGVIAPTEVKTEFFKRNDLLAALVKLSNHSRVYLYARDSEGQEYIKKIGRTNNVVKTLSN